jgi:hypothetical protein
MGSNKQNFRLKTEKEGERQRKISYIFLEISNNSGVRLTKDFNI